MRNFQHLTKSQIQDIVIRFQAGERQADLARAFEVDHSTIDYHIKKFKRAYPEEGDVYALVKIDVRKTCVHPSSACTFCGEMFDQLMRAERELVVTLTKRLANANSRLRVMGEPVE